MSASTHQIAVKAVDQTAGAFGSIKNRAKATGASIRSMMGGALAAAGAYFTFRGVTDGINELGKLSDLAQKTSTNVGELTQATTALSVLGIQNMGVDQLAKAFDYMQKTTGRTGMSGFLETIGELGKIEDTAKRGQEAMRVFGRSGMEFMPLINAAKDGTAALQGVIAAMPGIPQAAADAGDAAADSMLIAANGIKSIWYQMLAAMCENVDDAFDGDIRSSTLRGVAYFEYFIKKTWRSLTNFGAETAIIFREIFKNPLETIKGFGRYFSYWPRAQAEFFKGLWNTTWKDWGEGRFFGDAFERQQAVWDEAADDFGKIFDFSEIPFLKDNSDLDIALENKLKKISEFKSNYENAAISSAARAAMDGLGGLELAMRKPQIRNDLILGGSNASNKLAAFGPTLQSEQKKTNALLERVVKNTERTADNTEEAAQTETPGVVD